MDTPRPASASPGQQHARTNGPVLQINHKKVPVFHGKKDKDSMTVLAWCHCMDPMKTSLGWSDEATFCNAIAALFGNAQRIMYSWAILYATNYRTTWTYL